MNNCAITINMVTHAGGVKKKLQNPTHIVFSNSDMLEILTL